MCTAISFKTNDTYFGRTLDHDRSYQETIVITPRNYGFKFSNNEVIEHHYAFIGVAVVINDYPLYYDAINEKGLGIAGLHFINNACYKPSEKGKNNIATYELIPLLLAKCASIKEVKELLKDINITDQKFNDNLPVAKLHWLICDKDDAITLEVTKDGLMIYENKISVLTNDPSFDKQMFALNNFRHLSSYPIDNHFSNKIDLLEYSRGMGAIGLPGDWSSQSRFIRATFCKLNSLCKDDEISSVNQFFHILNTVNQPRGCCLISNSKAEITIYTSCCNLNKGIYYYITYGNHRISAVDMHKANLDSQQLIIYQLIRSEQIYKQN